MAEPGHILLIEDEPNIAEAVRFVLTRAGWQVSLHGRGDDAMAAITLARPDAVILDMMLPGASGLEVLAKLRAAEGLGSLPVLMLTARGQARDREAAARAGATAFLAKPFGNDDLRAAVAALMAAPGAGLADA
ncbi:response regulator transcription factor [Paracoccus sp. p3-h83]|uniref:response regulator transcription factor n=1 Tax=Paracoccus sp. p3-h83 TaxID=3342805 RepID=UPI0035BACE4F